MCLLFTPPAGFWVTESVTRGWQPGPEGMFEFVLSARRSSRQVEEEEAGNLNFYNNNSFCFAHGRFDVSPPGPAGACPQYVTV